MGSLHPFLFQVRTKIQFGEGCVSQLGSILRERRIDSAFIISDNGVKESGILNVIENNLIENGIEYDFFTEVEPNPSVKTVHTGASIFKNRTFKSIIAVGGGSSMDAAKGIAVLASNEGSILDYAVGSGKEVLNPTPFLIAIPTTAGTGSEVTRGAVITDVEYQKKVVVRSPYIQMDVALLDPLLTLSKPPLLTASTGMDALTHAIEAYISKNASPMTDALSLQAIKLVGSNLIRCFEAPNDVEARGKMLLASNLAGMAFVNAGLGIVHSISHPLGSIYGIPHGLANAIILPYGMEFNYKFCKEKLAQVALALEIKDTGTSTSDLAYSAIKQVRALSEQFNIPTTLRSVGVSVDSLDELTAAAMEQTTYFFSDPRPITSQDMKQVINLALG